MSEPLELRSLRAADAASVLAVARRAIAATAGGPYTESQAAVWAQGLAEERLRAAIAATEFVGAEVGGRLAGFASLVAAEGLLDLLYVDADAQGCGVGRALVAEIERRARARGLPELRADASLPAAPMLAALGWEACGPHVKEVRGETFANTWMARRLV